MSAATSPIDWPAVARWNYANQRARTDYYARPVSSCPRINCDQLANGRVCIPHERDNAASAERRKRSAA